MSSQRPLTAVALSLGLSIAALEILPRFVDIPGLTTRDLNPIKFELSKANIAPHPYLAYANRPDYKSRPGAKHQVSHNSLGFRGPEVKTPKPAGTFRIVCLGGSSTYGHGPSSDETTWPARLQSRLRAARPDRSVEVVNAGCRGYSTFESLGNYAFRASDLEPDLVLIYHTVNDMRCALYTGVKRDNTHWRAIWREVPESPFEGSYTYLVWRRYLTDHFERFGDIGNFVIVDFDERLADGGAEDRPPGYLIKEDTELGYRNFHRNLESIVALAKNDGAGVAIGTQAVLRRKAPNQSDEVLAFNQMTQALRKVAGDKGALLVDVQAAVATEETRRTGSGEPSLFINSPDVVEVHLTDDGADLVASLFANALLNGGF
ncbi:MAG: hypothetical protein CL933_06680 [Deltaproteobacteria bacterium]|jgi:hypothetical protein|nr:hypothetical protein [Deltaproteobacteria bacterium]